MVNIIASLACVVIFCSSFYSGFATLTRWKYNEDEWPNECKTGTKQSPIALSADIAQEEDFSSFIFEQYDVTYPVQSKNNGHSVEVRLHVPNQPTVKGGGLPHVYVLDHLHFHWESEHVIEDERFPLELHLVHFASRYGNLSEALKYTSGVTVFSVLFYLSPDNDAHFEPLIAVIDKIQDQVNTVQELHINLNDFLPRDKAGFFRYNGSLTTPNCTEGIIWTVFTSKLPISKDQVKAFPYLKTEEHEELRKNYRSLQELNGRRVQIRRSPLHSSGVSINIDVTSKVVILLLFFKEVMRLV